MFGMFEEELAHPLTTEELAAIEERKRAALAKAMAHPDTVTRYVRLVINFSVQIAGTPPDDDGLNNPDPTYHARQARLLAAVRNNPDVLKAWIVGIIASEMDCKGYTYWEKLNNGPVSFQEVLAPAIAALPPEDQEALAHTPDLTDHSFFEDLIDLFIASFQISETPPVIY